jgi:hypothetical protein
MRRGAEELNCRQSAQKPWQNQLGPDVAGRAARALHDTLPGREAAEFRPPRPGEEWLPMSPVSRGISFHESLLYSLHRLADAAVICLAVRLAVGQTESTGLPELLTISAATILVFHVVSELSGLYRSWRGSRLRREIACVLITWCYTVPILLGIGLVTKHNADFSYESKLVWLLASPAAMVAVRIVLRKIQQRLRARGFNIRRYAICGVNELGIQLARNIERSPEMGLRHTGF